MPKINVLPKNIAELIAAGEVVERPASVVKELVENSVDAGAKSVAVEIQNGGIRYIRVTDDGCGISSEDVRTAFISHATSKISTADDLNSIFTLGFRGEALPSIAAVSRLTLLTHSADSENGVVYTVEGGEGGEVTPAGCPLGTTITVRDLFYNTPARMKFLKKDVTEGTAVADVVTRTALAHPEVRFSLIRDGKKTLSSPGNGSLKDTVYALFGKAVFDALLPCDYSANGIDIHGFISKPLNNRPNRNMQYFFVNGRSVRIPAAVPALDEAYKNSIMVGKFPMCFLSVTLDAEKTDVNVHPAKTEIRFSDESNIFHVVYYAAKSALTKGDTARPEIKLKNDDILAPVEDIPKQMTFAPIKTAPVQSTNNNIYRPETAFHEKEEPKIETAKTQFTPPAIHTPPAGVPKTDFKSPLIFNDSAVDPIKSDGERKISEDTGYNVPWKKSANINITVDDEPEDTKPEITVTADEPKKDTPEDFRIVGEVFKTYILVERGTKLLIIDKHAAHERMIFNRISAQKNTGENFSQVLLSPVSVTLSASEYAAVIENLNVFEKAGYLIEDFGDGAVAVRECPVELIKEDVASLVQELAGQLQKGNTRAFPEKLEWILDSTACRAAIKAGDELKPLEMYEFVKLLLSDDSIRYCPHGRPVMYELSKHEIEKQFGRI